MPKKLPKYCSDFEKQREWGRLLFTVYHQDYLIQKLSPILAAITLQETQLFANVRVSKNSRKLKGDSLGRAETTDVSSFMLCPGFAVTQFHPTSTYRCKLPPSSVVTIFLHRPLPSSKYQDCTGNIMVWQRP